MSDNQSSLSPFFLLLLICSPLDRDYRCVALTHACGCVFSPRFFLLMCAILFCRSQPPAGQQSFCTPGHRTMPILLCGATMSPVGRSAFGSDQISLAEKADAILVSTQKSIRVWF